jgi:hypothetical protein
VTGRSIVLFIAAALAEIGGAKQFGGHAERPAGA